MKKYFLLALLGIALTGCEQRADSVSSITTGRGVELETLFKADGCTMYRFKDGSVSHYWANCQDRQKVQDVHSCGKNCTAHEEIETTQGN